MIRILVDSASDLTNDPEVYFVPLQVSINNHDYHDGVDIDRDTFYNLLINTPEFPKTSQPSPQDFLDIFNKVKNDNDELICILLSSSLSGTYQSAMLAKNIVDYDKIYLVDSLSASYAIKILKDKAVKMINENHSAKEIVEELESLKSRIKIIVSVDTLDYLCKGGRLSATSAAIGNFAKLKPIITVSTEGKVKVAAKRIGINKTIEYLVDTVCNSDLDASYPSYVLYTYGQNNVNKLIEKLNDNNFKVAYCLQIGSTIGSHVGPETFGIIYVVA